MDFIQNTYKTFVIVKEMVKSGGGALTYNGSIGMCGP